MKENIEICDRSKKFGIKREIQLEIQISQERRSTLTNTMNTIVNTVICQCASNIGKAISFHLYTQKCMATLQAQKFYLQRQSIIEQDIELKIKSTNERIPDIRNFLRDCHHYLTDLRFVQFPSSIFLSCNFHQPLRCLNVNSRLVLYKNKIILAANKNSTMAVLHKMVISISWMEQQRL